MHNFLWSLWYYKVFYTFLFSVSELNFTKCRSLSYVCKSMNHIFDQLNCFGISRWVVSSSCILLLLNYLFIFDNDSTGSYYEMHLAYFGAYVFSHRSDQWCNALFQFSFDIFSLYWLVRTMYMLLVLIWQQAWLLGIIL